MKYLTPLFLLLLLINLTGCSSQVSVLTPVASSTNTVSYNQGSPILKSRKFVNEISGAASTAVELSLLDFQGNEALFGVRVENNTNESLFFSPDNLSITISEEGEEPRLAKVLYAEEVVKTGGSSLIWDSAATVVTSGASIIPGAGALGNLAGRLVGLGVREGQRAAQPKISVESDYLKAHTLKPNSDYAGVVKVEFLETLSDDNRIVLNITTAKDSHLFEYLVKNRR